MNMNEHKLFQYHQIMDRDGCKYSVRCLLYLLIRLISASLWNDC